MADAWRKLFDVPRICWRAGAYRYAFDAEEITMPYVIIKWDEFGDPLLREWRPDTYEELLARLGDALF